MVARFGRVRVERGVYRQPNGNAQAGFCHEYHLLSNGESAAGGHTPYSTPILYEYVIDTVRPVFCDSTIAAQITAAR